VGRTSKKYALDKLALPSLWHVQARTNFTQIEVVALEEAGFLLSEKPKCPFVNQVGDNISTPINQHLASTPHNLFSDGTSTHIYKPLDPNAWPKSRNGKKICCPNIFKLSILQENKWKVGRALETTLLTPLTIPFPRYGWIY
jgi:hypothetical protein